MSHKSSLNDQDLRTDLYRKTKKQNREKLLKRKPVNKETKPFSIYWY